ncbi:MAG: hypothetical protein U0324_29505 [Polyangiales bacterium]
MTVDPLTGAFVQHPWAEATAHLADFDADALRRDLHGWVRDPAVRTVADLRARLAERLGPHVGGLALASVCAAFGVSYARDDHRLPRAEHEHGARAGAVEAGVVAAEREVTRLRRLAAVIDPVDGTPDSVDAAVDGIVDLVMEETALEDAWYQELEGPLAWLADRLGRPRDGVEVVVDGLYRVVFSSWVAPPPAGRRFGVRTISDTLTGIARLVPPEVAARVARVLRPSRERLAEARDAVAGRGPAEALEALIARGLLDASWADGARLLGEGGHVTALSARGAPPFTFSLHAAAPGTRDADLPLLTWLAADAAQVLRAEAVAQEVVARLGPFGFRQPGNLVAWVPTLSAARLLWPANGWEFEVLVDCIRAVHDAFAALGDSVEAEAARERAVTACAAGLAAARARGGLSPDDPALLAMVWEAAAQWEELAALGATIASYSARRKRRPAPLAARDAPSPFEAIAALWDTGYGLRGVTDDGILVLCAPPP